MRHFGDATKVSILAVGGQWLAYLLSVVLARRLRIEEFETYVIASAAFVLMVTFVPRGFDKYTLRLLPMLLDRADWSGTRGYLKFAVRRTLWTSLCVGGAVGAWAWWTRDLKADTRFAVMVSCLSLPGGALVHIALEVLTAFRRAVAATIVFRIGVPAMVLIMIGAALVQRIPVNGTLAVGCWGMAWMVALLIMAAAIRRAVPPEVLRAEAHEDTSSWETHSRPFWIYRISLALLGQASVIALDWLQPSASAVGAYAAAMGTASLALVLATATNRVYARQLSVLLERREFEAVFVLRRKRLQWIALPVALYLVGTLVFTRKLLAFFRPEFVSEGVVALRLLSLAVAFVVLFAMAPTYMKFRQRNRALYTTVANAAVLQIMLLWWLVPRLGTTGAALAYVVAMCGMYGNFARLAHRELTLLRDSQ